MKKLAIALLILVTVFFAAGCNTDPSEKVYKEALKQAEEIKKLSMKEKFDKLTNETTMIESRALLGAPAYSISGKLGDTDITVYIWKDSEGNEVGVAFNGAKLMDKLDKEQIEYFKNNSKSIDGDTTN